VRLPVEDAEVDRQHQDNDDAECDPQKIQIRGLCGERLPAGELSDNIE
jgi:hypothetical protein